MFWRASRHGSVSAGAILGLALALVFPFIGASQCAPEFFPVCDLYDRIGATIGADATLTIPDWFWKEEHIACIPILVAAQLPIEGYDPLAKIEALRAILIPHYDFGGIEVYVSVVLEGYLPICGQLPDPVILSADAPTQLAGFFNTALAENPLFIEAFVPTERPTGVGNVVAVFERDVVGYPGYIDLYYGGRLFYINYVAEQVFAELLHTDYSGGLAVTFTSPALD